MHPHPLIRPLVIATVMVAFTAVLLLGLARRFGTELEGMPLALLEAAANPALHSVLSVRAPSGAKLTITKSFTMETSPVINADSTRGAPLTFPMQLTSSVVMPKRKTELRWHVNPSVRPSQHAQEWLPESWKVTCTLNARSQSVSVMVKRGAVAQVDLRACR